MNESFDITYKSHAGDSIFVFETKIIFQACCNMNMKPIPCTYTGEFVVFDEPFAFFDTFLF